MFFKSWEEKFKLISNNNGKLTTNTPTVIDFYAQWCQPCKISAPIVEELSEKYSDVTFYKVDVDQESNLAQLFNVRSIPTFIFINSSGESFSVIGWSGQDKFIEYIDKNKKTIEE